MARTKTKSMENIDHMLEKTDGNTVRHKVLESARTFKSSWIGLGQALYTVWKDKLYREWGYGQFEIYTQKEIGIRKQTALKLLRSYFFLEKEGPQYINREDRGESSNANIPTCEAVDTLRLAKKKKGLDPGDYDSLKKKVLDDGKDAKEVKKDLTQLVREREELMPEEAWDKKRLSLLRRFLGTLRSLKTELIVSKMMPAQVLKETEKLITRLESELS